MLAYLSSHAPATQRHCVGVGVCVCVYELCRDKLEVFLPPRANRLPEGVRRAYTHREIASQALTQTGKRTAAAAVFAGESLHI